MQEIKLHNNICEDFLFAPENFWDLIDAHLPIVTWLTKKIPISLRETRASWVLTQLGIDSNRIYFDSNHFNISLDRLLVTVWKFIETLDDFENAKISLRDAILLVVNNGTDAQDQLSNLIIYSIKGHFDPNVYPKLVLNEKKLLLKIRKKYEKLVKSCQNCINDIEEKSCKKPHRTCSLVKTKRQKREKSEYEERGKFKQNYNFETPECKRWQLDDSINPFTNRKIKVGKSTWKYFDKECKAQKIRADYPFRS